MPKFTKRVKSLFIGGALDPDGPLVIDPRLKKS